MKIHQHEVLYIIHSVGMAYHQGEALHIIKPQDIHASRDDMQKRLCRF